MAASRWRCPSSTGGRDTSPRSFPNCCSGSGPDRLLYGSDYAHLDAEMAGRQVHGVRSSGRRQARKRASMLTLDDEKQDPRPQRRPPLRHRRRGAEEEDQAGGGYAHLPEAVHAPGEGHAAWRTGGTARSRQRTGGRSLGLPARRDRPGTRRVGHRVELRRAGPMSIAEGPGPHRVPVADLLVRGQLLVPDGGRHARGPCAPWTGSRGSAVGLGEHMYADKINARYQAGGLSFRETFGAEAGGELDDLRQSFLVKAFQRRQAALLNHLAGVGHSPRQSSASRRGNWIACRSMMKASDWCGVISNGGPSLRHCDPRRLLSSMRKARR